MSIVVVIGLALAALLGVGCWILSIVERALGRSPEEFVENLESGWNYSIWKG